MIKYKTEHSAYTSRCEMWSFVRKFWFEPPSWFRLLNINKFKHQWCCQIALEFCLVFSPHNLRASLNLRLKLEATQVLALAPLNLFPHFPLCSKICPIFHHNSIKFQLHELVITNVRVHNMQKWCMCIMCIMTKSTACAKFESATA